MKPRAEPPAEVDDFEDTQVLKRNAPPEPPVIVVRAVLPSTFAHWIAQPAASATVGRSPDADLVLADPSVSRFHARIDVDAEGRLSIVDLGSTNGTLVNQAPVAERAPVEPGDRLLVGDIAVTVERMAPAEVEALKRATHRLDAVARDAVTGLLPRHWLETDLQTWVDRHEDAACCLFIDLDHFKQVNDRHLHAVGDRVLREVSDIVRRTIRDEDVAVRYGGDELVVFLSRCRLPVGISVADRLRNAVALHAWGDPLDPGAVTLSIGVAQLRAGEGLRDWLARADAALYRAKVARNATAS
jgi:diguanylate cyclase (GGDEF)-like protein